MENACRTRGDLHCAICHDAAVRLGRTMRREPRWANERDADRAIAPVRCVRQGAASRSPCKAVTSHGSAVIVTTCSATGSSAPRDRHSSSSTRIPTACARRSCAATASSSKRRGTRHSPRSTAAWRPIIEQHGRDAVAVYLGNPNAHSLAGMLYGKALVKGVGSRNVYTASTVDQRPKELSSALMFGGGLIVPVPDVDRTDFLLILGANPYASNGSLATAPDWPGRIEALRARGGKLVVVDPRRSRTAEEADEWIAVRPGSDPFLLAAMVRVLLDEGLVDLGDVAPSSTAWSGSGRRWPPSVPTRSPTSPASTRRRSAGSPASSPPPRRPPSTGASGRPPPSSERWPAGSSTCSTSAPATSTDPAGRCSQRPQSPARTPTARRVSGAACGPTIHARGFATCPARSVSCPPCASPRRSRPRERARSGRWCASRATRCCRYRTASASTRPSTRSS